MYIALALGTRFSGKPLPKCTPPLLPGLVNTTKHLRTGYEYARQQGSLPSLDVGHQCPSQQLRHSTLSLRTGRRTSLDILLPDIHSGSITVIITPISIFMALSPVSIATSTGSDLRLLPHAQSPPSKPPQGFAVYFCFMLYPALLAVKVPRLLLPRADTLEAATEAALAGGFRAPMRQDVLTYLLGACLVSLVSAFP